MRPRRVLVAVAALASAVAGLPAEATDAACAWPAQLDSTAFNVAYPDEAAHYWITALPAARGVSLEIRGTFPAARYMSFVTYNESLQSVDGLHDAEIAPDPGSLNPFLPGADRTGAARSYTVRVEFGRDLEPEPNTVYTVSADGSKQASSFIVGYRVFRPDHRFAEIGDRAGGAGLPRITMVLEDGSRVEIPECTVPGSPANDLNRQVAGSSLPGPGSPLGGGFSPPVWHKFFNTVDSVATAFDNPRSGSAVSDSARPYSRSLPQGGFVDNPDNNYIYSFVNHFSFGPVLVIEGRLPATPDTYENAAVMGSGQLRYWSMCTNHAASQRYYACVADDQVVTDADGRYTIVVSTSANRPANATAANGVTWLAGGPTNDKVLILRNMLPAPGFAHSIQAASHSPTSVEATLDDYYPRACYMTVAAFEATGACD